MGARVRGVRFIMQISSPKSPIAVLFIAFYLLDPQIADANNSEVDLTKEIYETEKYWKRTHLAQPEYPREAQEEGLGGCAAFIFIISEQGVAEEIELYDSVPGNTFERVAERAIEKYRWQPTRENLRSQRVKTSVVITFEMENGKKTKKDLCDRPIMIKSLEMPDPISTPLLRKECPPERYSRLLKRCN